MASIFHAGRVALSAKLQRYRNKPFLEAMMGATALLALADDEIQLSERLALDFILENVKELKVFDVHKAINLFRDYGEAIQHNYDTGKEKVIKAVAKFSGDEDKGSLLIRACILIAKADGDFSEPEQEVLDELCRLLSLESSKVCKIAPEEE